MAMQSDISWLTTVQRDIPLERHPFAVIGEHFGMSESEVLKKLQTLFDEGKARRIGGVFDVRGVGYRSALCAATVPEAELEVKAALLIPRPGLTHCYQRGWPAQLSRDMPEAPPVDIPNLWFTLAAQGNAFDATVASIREDLAPCPVFIMSAVRHFKIDVVFDVGGGTSAGNQVGRVLPTSCFIGTNAARPEESPYPSPEKHPLFSERDRALIRAMQGLIPRTPCPYDEIAKSLGRDPDDVLECLRGWKAAGVLRRVGVILYHRKMGLRANGMCVWHASPDVVEKAGKTLASFPHVTHCYEREVMPGFPYNLFAMIHADSYESAFERFHALSQAADLSDGCVLFSLREFKKTSPRYFCESGEQR